MLFMTMSITPTCLAAPAVTDARMDSQALFRAFRFKWRFWIPTALTSPLRKQIRQEFAPQYLGKFIKQLRFVLLACLAECGIPPFQSSA